MNLSMVLSTQPTKFQAATMAGDLRSNLATLRGLGYQGVELAIRDPQAMDLAYVSDTVKEFALKVPAIGTGQAWGEEGLSFTDPDPQVRKLAIERIMNHVPVAAHFNAVIIIGLIRGIVKPNVTYAQSMAWLIQALQECCKVAALSHVKLALEPINRFETTLVNNVVEGMQLIDEVGMDNFGLLLDTFHMNIEEPRMEESMRICSSRVFHFHVADSNRWYPGAGHLDFASILSTLKEINYQGFISGEFMPKPDMMTSIHMNIAHMESLIRKLNLS